ncbi:MAG: putative lipopolysaccharide O-side chain biosynthesis protein [Candidatus Berkelbacteria bacterium Athens1014_28]|uniref:Putative lipopolysaccharide O-side chain biosynthesis protein n=1 Tax=Candidatus Berkelbacteria bacterium Athens1014_28 TaxID=2017145 RepID=A0A554LQ20_9BACT|nr:MAG: putative lipopolysaccharide O-side chain biosynthesis protein [Candidatus Berkelbacteria bacterium Athens1014_28]
MYRVAIVELVGKVLQTGIIIIAVVRDWGFLAIMSSLLAYMAFNFFFVLLLSRKYVKFHLHFNFPYWKKFLKMSAPMGISVIITFLYFKMDTILLSVLKGSAEVGIYNAAYKILENITFFPAMIVGLTLPLTSKFIFTDKKKFAEISNKTAKVFFLLIIPLFVAVMFLAEDIMLLIGGAEFAVSANTLRILIIALVFIFFGNFFNNILLAGNLQKKMMVALGFCAAFNIGANFVMIPLYSYTGAAITSALTEMLVIAITSFLVFKYLDYVPKIENWLRFVFSGLMMAIFLFLFRGQNFFLLALGSSAIYFLFLWLTRAITATEIKSIMQKDVA